jgi:ornithine cyclodeaminase/alanine dehydrogenase-like protein (mu-crystallin family)
MQNGSLTLFDNSGKPRALLNTSEITAFRTALASTMLFKKRHNVHDVVVFGAGRQAYWHIRLALLLRGEDIHHLNIINRDFERVHQLLETLYNPHEAPKTFNPDPQHIPTYRQTAPSQSEALHRPKIQILTPSHGEYTRYLHATIRSSSCIFLCTPSIAPLFPAPILTNPEGRKKGRYIAAIGSISPSMIELHPDIVRQNVAPEHGHRHFHKHAQQGGAIVVDSVDKCLKEAGEVVQAGLGPEQVVEIGELVMLKRDAERRRMECMASKKMEAEGLDAGGVELGECETSKKKKRSGNGKEKDKHHESEDKAHKGLIEWLVKGNVIYKSVGLGLMDVVVGTELVNMADARNIGTRIDNF